MRVLVAICSIALGATVALAQYGPEHLPQPPEATRGQPVRPGTAEVTGRVVDFDPATGRLVIDAQGETWKLHFPPAALRDLHRGETVTARVALRSGIDSTSTEGAGSYATDPETGAPGARSPGAR
jgi:hypothetical protein